MVPASVSIETIDSKLRYSAQFQQGKSRFTAILQNRLVPAFVAGMLLLACAGCQTFSLSEEDFQKQQKGQMVDPATGQAVAVVGTVAYYGAVIGQLMAVLFGK
jgi:hypothetical protein